MNNQNFFRKYADIVAAAEATVVTESKNNYKYIQQEVDIKDMDTMSPEELQQYADFIRQRLNRTKRWIRDEFGSTYEELKNSPSDANHWSVKTVDEYKQELKKAKELGAVVKPMGGAKATNSIRGDSRGIIGGGLRD